MQKYKNVENKQKNNSKIYKNKQIKLIKKQKMIENSYKINKMK